MAHAFLDLRYAASVDADKSAGAAPPAAAAVAAYELELASLRAQVQRGSRTEQSGDRARMMIRLFHLFRQPS
jgi:hypothetical protein